MDYAGDSGPEIEDDNIVAENSGKNGALSIPLAAIGFMTRLASGIFSRGRRHSDPLNLDTRNEDDHQPDELTLNRDPDGGSSSQKPYDIENQLAKLTTNCEVEEHDGAEATDLLEIAETLCNLKPPESDAPPCEEFISTFRGFDIVRDPFDHHFLGAQGQVSSATHTDNEVSEKKLCMCLDLSATSLTTLCLYLYWHIYFRYFSEESSNESLYKFTEQRCQEVAQESSTRLGHSSK